MSSPSTTRDPSSARDASTEAQRDERPLERFAPQVAKPIRVSSFWLAIVLPFLHVPLLATGLSSAEETTVFLVLLACNLLGLYVGHTHRA